MTASGFISHKHYEFPWTNSNLQVDNVEFVGDFSVHGQKGRPVSELANAALHVDDTRLRYASITKFGNHMSSGLDASLPESALRYGCVRELGDIMNRVSFRNGETGIPPFKKLLFCLSNVALGDAVFRKYDIILVIKSPLAKRTLPNCQSKPVINHSLVCHPLTDKRIGALLNKH
ncbi:hypothetical protein P5673_013780 [Acropora cervicornis]|uniref:Uncharacterized protein n=1 Tax=Acropora cervicornis TaxID=6130 RepID=A0AAD9QK84_ACRCE|nr:hypothetical protein P5673_013780 [Acropora cervicornis]